MLRYDNRPDHIRDELQRILDGRGHHRSRIWGRHDFRCQRSRTYGQQRRDIVGRMKSIFQNMPPLSVLWRCIVMLTSSWWSYRTTPCDGMSMTNMSYGCRTSCECHIWFIPTIGRHTTPGTERENNILSDSYIHTQTTIPCDGSHPSDDDILTQPI